jgi:hypothetical protein
MFDQSTFHIFSHSGAQRSVLPGLEAAFPPIEKKSTAICRKLLFQIFLKFRYFSAIFGLFVKVNS